MSGKPISPALQRIVRRVAAKDAFVRKWTATGMRAIPNAWKDHNPNSAIAAELMKKGDCIGAREALKVAKNGLEGEPDDYDLLVEPDFDEKVVKQMERALNRVCKKR